jgi:selenocysteine lyase/cysteine desulfurase
MTRYDVPATCRASCYVYNGEADLDALGEAICKARGFFLGD